MAGAENSPMRMVSAVTLGLTVGVVLPTLCRACLWDSDTLAAEARGLPGIVEVTTGFFPRNPPKYYEMRLERVERELAAEPSALNSYDDAGVACDRLHRPEQAMEWMAKKRKWMEAHPDLASADDWYRYHANLGTFFAHQWFFTRGENVGAEPLREAISHIEQAIEINPDAHFGRERIQLAVIRFALEAASPVLSEDLDRFDIFMNSQDGMASPSRVEGLVGLIVLGAAWESPDLFQALSQTLALRDLSLALFARLRMIESFEAGRTSIDPRVKSEDDVMPLLSRFKDKTQYSRIEADFATLRAAADAWQEKRTRYMEARFDQGMHPDVTPTFWSKWSDPTDDPNKPTARIPFRMGNLRTHLHNPSILFPIVFMGSALVVVRIFFWRRRIARDGSLARAA